MNFCDCHRLSYLRKANSIGFWIYCTEPAALWAGGAADADHFRMGCRAVAPGRVPLQPGYLLSGTGTAIRYKSLY